MKTIKQILGWGILGGIFTGFFAADVMQHGWVSATAAYIAAAAIVGLLCLAVYWITE